MKNCIINKTAMLGAAVVIAIRLIAPSPANAALLASYTFETGSPATFTAAPTTLAPDLTASDFARGAGLTAQNPVQGNPSSGLAISSSGWTVTANRDLEDYYEFSVAASTGYIMTLERLEMDESRSGTGPQNWAIYSSLDSYSTALATFTVPDNLNWRANEGVDFGASFADLSSPVTFRVYGYAAEGGAGTWRIDNVELSGTLSAVPEPREWGLIAAFGMMGVAGFHHWRRRRSLAEA